MWVAILILVAAFMVAFFISRDAKKKGRNSLFWFIFTLLLFGLCAIPVYYYSLRRERRVSVRKTEG